MAKEKHFCAIKHNFKIWRALMTVWTEKYMTQADIVSDAFQLGKRIEQANISRYMNSFDISTEESNQKSQQIPSAEDILWLCKRYGVEVTIEVKTRKNIDPVKNLQELSNYDPKSIAK